MQGGVWEGELQVGREECYGDDCPHRLVILSQTL